MNENPAQPPEQPMIPISSRESVTERQVDTVLSVIGAMQTYLLVTHREQDNVELRVDGGVKSSAEVTFIKACERLDMMLTDNSRWHMGNTDDLFSALRDNQKSQAALNAQQALSVSELRRPSRIFHPSLMLVDGAYVAYYASSDFPGGILIGRGNTPAEALLDFDRAFDRIPDEQLKFNEESEAKMRAAFANVRAVASIVPAGKRLSRVPRRSPK